MYNGYTNYYTWTVASVIDNTEWIYDAMKNIAENTIDPNEKLIALNNYVRYLVTKMRPEAHNAIWDPITNDIMREKINYAEIVKTFLEE